jgi:hypothetical protein
LNLQAGQRQTACILYIAAPHRSHTIVSVLSQAGRGPESAERTGVITG